MSSYAEPTLSPVTCPVCRKPCPGYHDLFNGEKVIRAACTAHRHPVVDRAYTGTAKSNWGTAGHGPVAEAQAEAESDAPEVQVLTPAELDRAVKEALAEMRATDAAEA